MTEKGKIKVDEYRRVCRLAGLVEVTNSKTFIFKTKDQKEGIELVAGEIKTFWIKINPDKSAEKVVDQPVDSKQILAVIGAFENDNKNKTKQTQTSEVGNKLPDRNETEKMEEPKKDNVGLVNSIPAILEEKRIVTFADIQEWKKLSTFERILFFQKTPKSLISKRRGYVLPEFAGRDKKNLTDENYKMFSYVEANIMKQEANIAFLFDWSAAVESEKYFEDEVSVRGYIRVAIDKNVIYRPCGGSCVKKGNMDWGDTLEGAISEMIKRGLYSLGFNGDVKRGEIE